MPTVDSRVWELRVDVLHADGAIRPMPDVRTPQRVELLARLLAGHGYECERDENWNIRVRAPHQRRHHPHFVFSRYRA